MCRCCRRLVLVCALLLASPAYAVIAQVQKVGIAGGNNGAVATVTCAFAANNAAGNLIVVGGGDAGATSGHTLSVSDSLGNTYTAAQSNFTGANNDVLSLWYVASSLAGANTVTVTVSGTGADHYCWAAEYSGIATVTPLDQTTAAANAGVTAWTSGNVTTTQASELLIGWAMGGNGAATATAGTGWTLQASTTAGSQSPAWEDQIVSVTGTFAATFTYSAAVSGVDAIATFKAAGAGPPPCASLIALRGAGCR